MDGVISASATFSGNYYFLCLVDIKSITNIERLHQRNDRSRSSNFTTGFEHLINVWFEEQASNIIVKKPSCRLSRIYFKQN